MFLKRWSEQRQIPLWYRNSDANASYKNTSLLNDPLTNVQPVHDMLKNVL